MPYNVMCVLVCTHECIQYSMCVVVLWCARIKPSRSKNTYVQAGIQSCLRRVKTHVTEKPEPLLNVLRAQVKTINIISDF